MFEQGKVKQRWKRKISNRFGKEKHVEEGVKLERAGTEWRYFKPMVFSAFLRYNGRYTPPRQPELSWNASMQEIMVGDLKTPFQNLEKRAKRDCEITVREVGQFYRDLERGLRGNDISNISSQTIVLTQQSQTILATAKPPATSTPG